MIVKRFISFIKSIIKSRITQLLVLFHCIFLLVLFIRKDLSGQSEFQDYYFLERLFYFAIWIIDSPSLILSASLSTLFFQENYLQPVDLYIPSTSFIMFFVFYSFFSTIQWALIGYGIEKLIKRRNAIKK